jgi:two-component system, LytTR family, response regulator
VVQVTAEGSYCKFILTSNKTILLSKTVGSVEEILKDHPDFFRAHKSYLVNLKHIDRYIRGDGGEIVMQDGTMISLSRNKKDEFLQLFEKV